MCFQTILTSKCLSAAPNNSKFSKEPHHLEYCHSQERSNSELLLANSNGNGNNVQQSATMGRRRKGSTTKVNNSVATIGATAISKPHNNMHLSSASYGSEFNELRSALQDREAVIQKLRIQLCLGKLPRPSGPPFTESEIPVAERKLHKLKTEADNKKTKIRSLKNALEHFDINE